jgi:hypothetical protein
MLEGFYRHVLRITKSHCGVMVGGFGQLPGVGVAGDVSTQVSLALLLTSPTDVRHAASVLTFGKELMFKDQPLHKFQNWELKLPFLEVRGHVADSTVSAQQHGVDSGVTKQTS